MLVLTHIGESDEPRLVDKAANQILHMRFGYCLNYDFRVSNEELYSHWKHHRNLVLFDHACDVGFWQTLNERDKLTIIPAQSKADMLAMVPMCFPEEYVLITEIRVTDAMDFVVEAMPFSMIPVQGELLSDLRHLVMDGLDF